MSDCIFCEIVSGNIPAKIIAENTHALAFNDISPQAPTHVLVIPKQHFSDVTAITSTDADVLSGIFSLIRQIANDLSLENGFRVVTNTGNEGGQTVAHLHFHLLGGRQLQWPPG